MALEVEIAMYERLLPTLLTSSAGKYAVIKGEDFIGTFDDMDEGYRAALNKYGITSFLLRRIQEKQPVYDLTHIRLGLIRVSP